LLGTRYGKEYKWLSFKEVGELARYLAAGMTKLDLIPEIEAEGKMWKFLGIKAKNRKEWGLLHTANYHCSTTTVAFYDNLGEESTIYIINQTQMTTIAASNDIIGSILDLKSNDMKLDPSERKIENLKNIINMDEDLLDEDKEKADKLGMNVYTFEEVISAGKEFTDFKPIVPKKDDCYMLSYTSGTTGVPKGVKLTHKMMIVTITSLNISSYEHYPYTENDVYLSYLPYAHIFE